jgi:hypothetical protein
MTNLGKDMTNLGKKPPVIGGQSDTRMEIPLKEAQITMTLWWEAGIRPSGYESGPSQELVNTLKAEIEFLRKLVEKLGE